MIVYTFTTKFNLPLIINKQKYILINTDNKITYTHLYINILHINLLLDYLDCNIIEKDSNVLLQDGKIIIEEVTSVKSYRRKIEEKINELSKEDTLIENIFNKIKK